MNGALNLRLFRKANGLTQDAVAEYLGVSPDKLREKLQAQLTVATL